MSLVTEHDLFITKLDGLSVEVISDGFSVVIRAGALRFRLTQGESERFAMAFIAACWQASRNESADESADVAGALRWAGKTEGDQ